MERLSVTLFESEGRGGICKSRLDGTICTIRAEKRSAGVLEIDEARETGGRESIVCLTDKKGKGRFLKTREVRLKSPCLKKIPTLLAQYSKGLWSDSNPAVIEAEEVINTVPETLIAACRGRAAQGGGTAQRLEVRGSVSNALTGVQKDNLCMELYRKEGKLYKIRLRRLTPKECWRVMGIDDSDYAKAAAVNSSTQLYKQAGNGIVVDVMAAVFKELMAAI